MDTGDLPHVPTPKDTLNSYEPVHAIDHRVFHRVVRGQGGLIRWLL
jgi:hypothetical protein